MTSSVATPADLMRAARLVPVLTIPARADAVGLARALVAGGVRMLEITLRTPAGAAAARLIRDEVPEAIVGLGTVVSVADLELARELDLRFAFSPGATPALLDAARAGPVLPDRRHRRGADRRLPGAAQRGRGRRLVAGAGGRDRAGRLGGDHLPRP